MTTFVALSHTLCEVLKWLLQEVVVEIHVGIYTQPKYTQSTRTPGGRVCNEQNINESES